MSVDRREAARVAELARLALDEEELDALAVDLSRILDHVRVLQRVPPAGGEFADDPEVADELGDADGPDLAEELGLADGLGLVDELGDARPGFADEPDPLAHPLEAIAPDFRDGFFVVPPPPGVLAGEDDT